MSPSLKQSKTLFNTFLENVDISRGTNPYRLWINFYKELGSESTTNGLTISCSFYSKFCVISEWTLLDQYTRGPFWSNKKCRNLYRFWLFRIFPLLLQPSTPNLKWGAPSRKKKILNRKSNIGTKGTFLNKFFFPDTNARHAENT